MTRRYARAHAGHETRRWRQGEPLTWEEFTDDLPACYLPGEVREGSTKRAGDVTSRSVLTADEDAPQGDWLGRVAAALPGVAHATHETRSSTAEAPRYRLLVPLSRDVTPAEYRRIAHALRVAVGDWGRDTSWTQPERMMRGNEARPVTRVEGAPLDVAAWLARPAAVAVPDRESACSLEQDYAEGEPPSARQVDKAGAILRKAAREVETLTDESEGEPFDGRNDALIRRLPTLYRLALGGCLTEDDVDSAMWTAACAAPGDAPWTEKEHEQVSRNAREYAAGDGGGRPTVVEAADEFEPVQGEPGPAPPELNRRFTFRSGGSFILDTNPDAVPVWGSGAEVLMAEGEALILAAAQGLGKTTLAQQFALARCGLGSALLGYPVQPGEGRVLYLAMDRPKQAARSFQRMVTADQRGVLDDRLAVWEGPPFADLAENTDLLAEMCAAAGADTVVVDSLKDAALNLSEDGPGSGWNRARQTALAAGVEVLELHHNRKRQQGAKKGSPTIDEIYGSTWITSGAGSVLLLTGDPGDLIVGLHHVKQPADPVGPLRLLHDHDRGVTSVYHSADLVLLAGATPGGVSAREAAEALFETDSPDANQKKKAERRLARLVGEGLLAVVQEGDAGSKTPTLWGRAA